MTTGMEDRAYWVSVLERLARPVLMALAARSLKSNMPVEVNPRHENTDRIHFSHLEAFGRLLAGIAPWMETGPQPHPRGEPGLEDKLCIEFASLARQAMDAATHPDSPDFLNFGPEKGPQPLVDTAFLAQGILRAPNELWGKLNPEVRKNLSAALKRTRLIKPYPNNWLLFSALVEAALAKMGEDWDPMRVDYALRQHEQWYKGDGVYGDGEAFHFDYYNSFVIQPMLLDISRAVSSHYGDWQGLAESFRKRARRHAEVLERMISPEGTFPPVGRSLAYRFGAFHLLAQAALTHEMPATLAPAQVRCALTAVLHRMAEAPGTFDSHGWLTIGFCGRQPDIGEGYISIGSLYLCSTALLPLGLPPEDDFWQGPETPWTSKKLWSGEDLAVDKAIEV